MMTIRLILIGLILGMGIGFIGFKMYHTRRTTFAVDDTTINGCARLTPKVQGMALQTTNKIISTTKNLAPHYAIIQLNTIVTRLKKVETTFLLRQQTEHAIATKCIINNILLTINMLRAEIITQKNNTTSDQGVKNNNQKNNTDRNISSNNNQIDSQQEKKAGLTGADTKTGTQNDQLIEAQKKIEAQQQIEIQRQIETQKKNDNNKKIDTFATNLGVGIAFPGP